MFRWFKRLFLSHKNRKETFLESVNVVESIASAKSLHKELIRLAHPDKNPMKVELAQEITELLNMNRYNYRELLKLKESAVPIDIEALPKFLCFGFSLSFESTTKGLESSVIFPSLSLTILVE